MSQGTQTRALYQPIGVGWGERWEGISEGTDIYIPMADSCGGLKQQNCVQQLSFN